MGAGSGARSASAKGGDHGSLATYPSGAHPAARRGVARHRPRVDPGGRRRERIAGRQCSGRRRQGPIQGRHPRRAGQPQPVRRLALVVVRDLVSRLRPAGRVRLRRAQADQGRGLAGLGHRLDGHARRQDLDVHDPERGHVAGRRAAHGERRRLHLQLHQGQRPHELHHRDGRHQERRRRRRHHGGVRVLQAEGQHAHRVGPHPARAHLVQGPGQGRRQQVSRTTRRSSAPGRSSAWSGRRTAT